MSAKVTKELRVVVERPNPPPIARALVARVTYAKGELYYGGPIARVGESVSHSYHESGKRHTKMQPRIGNEPVRVLERYDHRVGPPLGEFVGIESLLDIDVPNEDAHDWDYKLRPATTRRENWILPAVGRTPFYQKVEVFLVERGRTDLAAELLAERQRNQSWEVIGAQLFEWPTVWLYALSWTMTVDHVRKMIRQLEERDRNSEAESAESAGG